MLEKEKPNLVILTGDIVTESKKKGEFLKNWGILTDLFIEYQVPYAVAFGNHVLPVANQKGEVEKILYCMDSRSYSLKKGVDGYGWFDHSQVGWFARTNHEWLAKNKEIQALLFFHIPLPEYKDAFEDITE